MKYCVCAVLDDLDDDALIFLTRVLPCLANCGLATVCIAVWRKWSANSQIWQIVDDTILHLSQGKVSVALVVHPNTYPPSWDMLPYECLDDFCEQVLPKCAAKGIIVWTCNTSENCRLHKAGRRVHASRITASTHTSRRLPNDFYIDDDDEVEYTLRATEATVSPSDSHSWCRYHPFQL